MTPTSPVLTILQERFRGAILETHAFRGDETVVVRKEQVHAVLQFLRDDSRLRFNFLMDLTAVDWLERRPRFDVVYHLYSLHYNRRLRVKTQVDDGEAVDSVTDLWKVANWLEREVFDMFGIRFRHHPDLRRILMYDEFQGHPLRKDYPLRGEQPRVPYRIQPRDPWSDPDRWRPSNESDPETT